MIRPSIPTYFTILPDGPKIPLKTDSIADPQAQQNRCLENSVNIRSIEQLVYIY